MDPSLEPWCRRFEPVDGNVRRPAVPVVLVVTTLTVPVSAPVAARTPKITKSGAPAAVTAVALDGGQRAMDRPVSDGGSPIAGYTVTASDGGQTCTTTGAATGTVKDRPLVVRTRSRFEPRIVPVAADPLPSGSH